MTEISVSVHVDDEKDTELKDQANKMDIDAMNDAKLRCEKDEEKLNGTEEKSQKGSFEVDNCSLDDNDGDENIKNKEIKGKNGNLDEEEIGPVDDTAHKRFLSLIDSDSEEDNILFPKLNENIKSSKSSSHKRLSSGSNSENEMHNSDSEEENLNKSAIKMKSSFKTLFNSDSEEEKDDSTSIENNDKASKRKSKKNKLDVRKVSLRASKAEAMKLIHSETQRLLRETKISIPYHIPKQRSLQEFMNRRKVLTNMPKVPTIAKLKMPSVVVSKVLEEKEEEAEIFYKSSDSEDEDPQSKSFSDKDNVNYVKGEAQILCSNVENSSVENSNIENTQEIINLDKKKEDAQNSSNVGTSTELLTQQNDNIKEQNIEFPPLVPNTGTHDTSEDLLNTNSKQNDANFVSNDDEENTDERMSDQLNQTVMDVSECEDQNDAPKPSTAVVKCNDDVSETSKDVPIENNSKAKKDSEEIIEVEKTLVVSSSNSKDESTLDDVIRPSPSPSSDISPQEKPEEASTSNINDYAEMMKESLGLTADKKDDYNEFGLPPPVFDDDKPSTSTKKKKILPSLLNLKPKLRGAPGGVINLSDDIESNGQEVNNLINRFFCKHTTVKKEAEDNSDVTAIRIAQNSNGISVVQEVLPYKSPIATSVDSKLNKPGAKLSRLREELKFKIALKRDEEWKQKEEEIKEQEKIWNEDQIEEEDGLTDEELEEEELTESEPEENDVCIVKKKKNRPCPYLDEEAEVSEEDADDEDDEDSEVLNEEDDIETLVESNQDEQSDLEDETNDENISVKKSKKPSRIIRPCENSNDSKDTEFLRSRTDLDMFAMENDNDAWPSDNENEIPASQACTGNDTMQQTCRTPRITSDIILNLVSPVTQLTALNTFLDSAKKESAKNEQYSFVNECESISIENTPVEKLFHRASNVGSKVASQKKLFDDCCDATTEEDLMNLCSGNFTGTIKGKNDLGLSLEPNASESQLLGLCSGSFGTQPIPTKEPESISAKNQPAWCKLTIVSSDEEDKEVEMQQRNKKRKVKRKIRKLDLSDEEDQTDASMSEEDPKEEEKYVDYDSEENEIVIEKRNLKGYAAGFLDEEAELSESDWDGSADEDEQGMDKFEVDECDEENIDETEVRDEVGKMHMRQILDEDQRDIRLLKEMLFEDGDLHTDGGGRERKFKWKNIDKVTDDNDGPRETEDNDGWAHLSDDENEIKWRKMRHEREKFLAEKMEDIDNEIKKDLNNSQFFKLGMSALSKIKSEPPRNQDSSADKNDRVEPRIPHAISDILNGSNLEGKSRLIHSVMKKRSLLARGEESLARIASLAKQREPSTLPLKRGNFVFARLSQPAQKETIEPTKSETNFVGKYGKRKNATSDATSFSAKRSKFSENSKKGKKF